MPEVRTHVILPPELLAAIDSLVGQRGRSRFLAQAARQEVKRLQLLKAVRESAGSWKLKHHPELKNGAAAWVSKMRREDESRRGPIPKRRS